MMQEITGLGTRRNVGTVLCYFQQQYQTWMTLHIAATWERLAECVRITCVFCIATLVVGGMCETPGLTAFTAALPQGWVFA